MQVLHGLDVDSNVVQGLSPLVSDVVEQFPHGCHAVLLNQQVILLAQLVDGLTDPLFQRVVQLYQGLLGLLALGNLLLKLQRLLVQRVFSQGPFGDFIVQCVVERLQFCGAKLDALIQFAVPGVELIQHAVEGLGKLNGFAVALHRYPGRQVALADTAGSGCHSA